MSFQPFRELMIPLSGVIKTTLLQKGDKQIFLIGENHTPKFCRDKGFTPLCSIIEEYLQTRTKDEPVDFMLEQHNEPQYLPFLEETRAICSKQVNPSNIPIIGLVCAVVDQYIPPVRSPILQSEILPQKTVVLPNARVHWLEPRFTHAKGRGNKLLNMMGLYTDIYMEMKYYDVNWVTTGLYTTRTIINHLLEIGPDIPWVLHEPRVIDMFHKDPNELNTLVFDTIPDRELFLQSSESSKIAFFKKVYETLADSKYFKKCYSGGRFMEWNILRDAFIENWRDTIDYKDNNTIENFYFCVQRFLMDFFTCCRILKEEGRWYKNMVIYAGFVHTRNIERMLLSLDFQNVPLPPIHYDPECSTIKKRKKRKTRRTIKRQ